MLEILEFGVKQGVPIVTMGLLVVIVIMAKFGLTKLFEIYTEMLTAIRDLKVSLDDLKSTIINNDTSKTLLEIKENTSKTQSRTKDIWGLLNDDNSKPSNVPVLKQLTKQNSIVNSLVLSINRLLGRVTIKKEQHGDVG